jgi:hypothetical protein
VGTVGQAATQCEKNLKISTVTSVSKKDIFLIKKEQNGDAINTVCTEMEIHVVSCEGTDKKTT